MTSLKTKITIHSLLAKAYPLQTQIGIPGPTVFIEMK